MTQTVNQAVEAKAEQEQAGPGSLVVRYRDHYAAVMPSHVKPDTWIRLAQGVLRRDQKLREVAERNPNSLLAALMECARLGHEPGTDAFALVPFGSEVVGIEQYQGQIERMYRAGAVASVVAEVVYAKDEFRYAIGQDDRPVHEPDWDLQDRGQLRLAYAYAVMRNGATSKVIVMNRQQIDQHRKESRGADKPDSPWRKWEATMWLKTVVRQLEKWVPTSTEYRVVMEKQATDAASRPRPQVIDGEFNPDTGEMPNGPTVSLPAGPDWPAGDAA